MQFEKTDDWFFQMKFVGRSIFKVTLSDVSSFSILFQELLIQKLFKNGSQFLSIRKKLSKSGTKETM